MMKYRITSAMDVAASNLKFKQDIPEGVRVAYLNSKRDEILSTYDVELSEAGQLVFKNKDTALVVNDPKNGNAPMTATGMLETSLSDILDGGRNVSGGGSQKGGGGQQGGDNGVFVLSATTRTEAHGQITDHLRSQGVTYDNPDYQKKFDALYGRHKVADLPTS